MVIFCKFQIRKRNRNGNHANVSRLHGLYRTAEYSKSWTPDDERNGCSKHVDLYKNCRINTYRKYILLVCLYNWLRRTVHKMSKIYSELLLSFIYVFIINCVDNDLDKIVFLCFTAWFHVKCLLFYIFGSATSEGQCYRLLDNT